MRNLYLLLLLSLGLYACHQDEDPLENETHMHEDHGSITVLWDSVGESKPTPMFKAFCVESEDYVFLGGGRVTMDSAYSKELWLLHKQSNSWTRVSDIPFDHAHSRTAFVINDILYVLVNKELKAYDITTDTWSDKAFYPGNGTHEVSAIGYEGFGYVGCGARLNPNHSERDFFIYDPESDTWTKKMDFLGYHRRACSVFAYEGKIYFGLGRCHDVTRDISFQDPMSTPQYLRDIFEYTIATNTWTKVSLFPDDEISSSDLIPCLQSENLVYFLGGFRGTHHQNMWEYNLSTGAYAKCTGTNHFTSHLANMYSNNGEKYVINGIAADSSSFQTGSWRFSID